MNSQYYLDNTRLQCRLTLLTVCINLCDHEIRVLNTSWSGVSSLLLTYTHLYHSRQWFNIMIILYCSKRRKYRALLRRKCESFWQAKVDAEKSSPCQLWNSVNALLGRGCVPPCDDISADQFHQFFNDKIAGVRSATADAPPLLFQPAVELVVPEFPACIQPRCSCRCSCPT